MWVLKLNPSVAVLEIRRRQVLDKVIAEPESNKVVDNLRNELVVMTTDKEVGEWENVSMEI